MRSMRLYTGDTNVYHGASDIESYVVCYHFKGRYVIHEYRIILSQYDAEAGTFRNTMLIINYWWSVATFTNMD